MKILVAIKRVIDYNVRIRVKSDNTGVETENIKMSMNPPDENAVEEALKLKEAGYASEVIAVTIGPEKSQETLRTALAMGSDRGIYVPSDVELEPLFIAKILASIVKKENPEIVLLGKQAIDDDCNQTGQMLAAILGWGQATFASNVILENNSVVVTREIDDGLETLKFNLPTVISCDLRLNEPRYATLPNIIKAKRKPIEKVTIEECKVNTDPRVQIIKVTNSPKRKTGVMVKDISELVDKLRNEAKVI